MAMSNFRGAIFDSVRRLARSAAHVLPQACALCAAPCGGALVCPACDAALPRIGPACPCCALPSPPWRRATPAVAASRGRRPGDARAPRSPTPTRSTGCWSRSSIAACSPTPTSWPSALAARIDVRPMPSSPCRSRARGNAQRGFNQADEIARRLARCCGVPLLPRPRPRAATRRRRRRPTAASACATCATRSWDGRRCAGKRIAHRRRRAHHRRHARRGRACRAPRGRRGRRPACVVARTLGAGFAMTDVARAMFAVVLVAPEIPPNTGNVIRLTANTATDLHLVEPLGFRMDDRDFAAPGLDYHEYARVRVHRDWRACRDALASRMARAFAFTTRAAHSLYDTRFAPGDVLVFGCETAGLPRGDPRRVRPGSPPRDSHAARRAKPQSVQRRRRRRVRGVAAAGVRAAVPAEDA